MNQSINRTFCQVKSETLLFNKVDYVIDRLRESELQLEKVFWVRLHFSDIFAMYPGLMPRVASTLRLPRLFELPVFLLSGDDAINKMLAVKYGIRRNIWGFENRKGGVVHSPDSLEEYESHMRIFARRVVHPRRMDGDDWLNLDITGFVPTGTR